MNESGKQTDSKYQEIIDKSKEITKKTIKISEIKYSDRIKKCFLIVDDKYEAIKKNMEKKGYDKSQPVLIWKERMILVDGHTRVKCAEECGIKKIPALLVSFKNIKEAIRQMGQIIGMRKNLTDAQIIKWIEAYLDIEKKENGKDEK